MAQIRRRERQRKRKARRQRLLAVILSAAALLVSLIVCLILLSPGSSTTQEETAQSAFASYDASQPFTAADLTSTQLEQIQQEGRMHVSDGPRGISVGDSLDKVIERFPTGYTGEQPEDEQILYCAEVFLNQNGKTTVLPPRALLTTDNSSIIITMLAPTSPYPDGTQDDYGAYEHVYCIFSIDPDTMTVAKITLGIDQ